MHFGRFSADPNFHLETSSNSSSSSSSSSRPRSGQSLAPSPVKQELFSCFSAECFDKNTWDKNYILCFVIFAADAGVLNVVVAVVAVEVVVAAVPVVAGHLFAGGKEMSLTSSCA